MSVMDRYQGPVVCGHCGGQWPCGELRRLSPPYLWPAGTTAAARIAMGRRGARTACVHRYRGELVTPHTAHRTERYEVLTPVGSLSEVMAAQFLWTCRHCGHSYVGPL